MHKYVRLSIRLSLYRQRRQHVRPHTTYIPIKKALSPSSSSPSTIATATVIVVGHFFVLISLPGKNKDAFVVIYIILYVAAPLRQPVDQVTNNQLLQLVVVCSLDYQYTLAD